MDFKTSYKTESATLKHELYNESYQYQMNSFMPEITVFPVHLYITENHK